MIAPPPLNNSRNPRPMARMRNASRRRHLMPGANPEQSFRLPACCSDAGGRRQPVNGPFYDALEQRDLAAREAALMAALPRIIAAAKEHAPAYRDRLARVRPGDITDRRALVDLPLTHKSDLIELQRQTPPFGGFAAVPVAAVARVFASPGPIYELEARARFLSYGAGPLCRRLPRGRSRTQYLFLPSDPGRGDGRERGALARLPGDPGGHRQERAAAAHDRRPTAGRLYRHPVLSQDHPRPRCRTGQRCRIPE